MPGCSWPPALSWSVSSGACSPSLTITLTHTGHHSNNISTNNSPGVPFSFGVFQNYYDTHAPFAGSGEIAVIGTCSMVCPPPSPTHPHLHMLPELINIHNPPHHPGNHVPRHPPHNGPPPALPGPRPLVAHLRPRRHVSRHRHVLLRNNRHPPHHHPGRALRHRRLHRLLSLHRLPRRVVRQAQRPRLRDHVVRHRSSRCRPPPPPRTPPPNLRLRNHPPPLGLSSLCPNRPPSLLYQTPSPSLPPTKTPPPQPPSPPLPRLAQIRPLPARQHRRGPRLLPARHLPPVVRAQRTRRLALPLGADAAPPQRRIRRRLCSHGLANRPCTRHHVHPRVHGRRHARDFAAVGVLDQPACLVPLLCCLWRVCWVVYEYLAGDHAGDDEGGKCCCGGGREWWWGGGVRG